MASSFSESSEPLCCWIIALRKFEVMIAVRVASLQILCFIGIFSTVSNPPVHVLGFTCPICSKTFTIALLSFSAISRRIKKENNHNRKVGVYMYQLISWSNVFVMCPIFFICYLSVFISMDYLQYWVKQMIFVCLRRLDIFDFSTIVDNEYASKENSVSSRKCSYWPCQLIVVLNKGYGHSA